MNNAEKFQEVFGYYATEMWAKSEKEFLDWINAEYNEKPALTRKKREFLRVGRWIPVTKVYRTNDVDFPNTHIEWETVTEPDDIDAVRCSKCGEVFDFEDARNWCTECGAKMKG